MKWRRFLWWEFAIDNGPFVITIWYRRPQEEK
jgi:hypothetical protein